MSAEAANTLAARWMIGGEWRAHPARTLVAAVAIAIGVALGFAIHLINASALDEFGEAVRTVNGDADLRVQAASPAGFDERLYPELARLRAVAGASPVVQLTGTVGDATAPATLLGLDLFRAASVTPRLLGQAGPQAAVFDADAVFLSDAALEAARRRIGDSVRLTAAGQTATLRIAGTLPAAAGQSLAVMDIATAQWRFGQIGRLQRVDLALADNVSPDEAARSIAAVLPPGAYVATAETEARQSDNLSRAYRVNLNMLALVALLTGAFLVYSAQSLSVVRRTPQFALLRVLGTTRRQLLRQVLTEGLLVGLAGALLGLLLGLALADAALRLLGGDLGGGYFRGDRRPELLFAPSAALVFLALGLVAAIAGSLAPAHNAARAQPAVALKNMGDVVDPRAAPRIAPALALAGAAAAFALLPPVGGLPLFGYLAMALALAGGVAAMPWLARTLLAPLQRLRSAPPAIELALRRLWGAPSQAATALCGIVASTSLMIAMAVMVTSFRGSVDEWLTQVLPADIYLSVQGAGMGFDPRTQAALRDVPGVGSVSFVASTPLRLSPDRPPVALLGEDIDPDDPTEAVPLLGGWRRAPDGLTPVWVSEAVARLYDVDVGDRLLLPAQGASSAETVFVSGVWRDYARQHGAIVINSEDYTRLTGNVLRTNAEIELKDGARPEVVVAALRAALLPEVNRRTAIASPGEIRALSLRIFDRSFAVTYALEAVAILVGLAGVAATFSAQTLARTREFGMLRHIGVARRQIAAMLAAEGALLGTVGVIAGIGLGVAMSQILIHVINPQSFNWTMETRLPLDLFAFVTVALIAAAAGTAVLSGRRALSTDAVRAVREDW